MIEFETFATHPRNYGDRYRHTNELFCGDDFDDFDIPLLTLQFTQTECIVIVAYQGREVLGGVILFRTTCNDNYGYHDNHELKWCNAGLGVHQDYRQQGIATQLIREQFLFMDRENVTGIRQSSYMDETSMHLWDTYNKFIEEYPHIVYRNDRKFL